MTRQHFEVVAATLKRQVEDAKTPEARQSVMDVIHALTQDFAEFNPRFDARRFKSACGFAILPTING
jgi:hypothetical protein